MKKYLSIASAIFILGCGGGGGGGDVSSYEDPAPTQNNSTIETNGYQTSIKPTDDKNVASSNVLENDSDKGFAIKSFNGPVSLTVKTDSPQNIYLIFSSVGDDYDIQAIEEAEFQKASRSESYAKVLDYRMNLKKYISQKTANIQRRVVDFSSKFKSVGDTKSFYLDDKGEKRTSTTLRLTRTVSTQFGDKTLNIYVSDNSFGDDCPKEYCIDQDMVDALGDKFLKSGSDNDIYDWETNIYGEEWGEEASEKISNLIGDNDEINILLTDIDEDDDPSSGVIGYFWPKDNMTNVDGSNQTVMFYIDSVMYANHKNRDDWSIDQKMPMEVISTLAHEFQHMISFYQKGILIGNGKSSSTWLDETLSCATEYILSSKIGTYTPRQISPEDGSAGSRQISDGQFPDFNRYLNSYNLTVWKNTAAQYGGAYAFGAYLTQNYGGAKLLHEIMHNKSFDENAILTGIKSTTGENLSIRELLNRCGVAISISDKITDPATDKPYLFNTGDYYCQDYNDVIYCMGSINFYNYDPAPTFSKDLEGEVYSGSNRYVRIPFEADGTYNLNINLGDGVMASVVVTDPLQD
jgi:hypothetical protein